MNRSIFGLTWATAVSVFLFSTACNETATDGGTPGATCASSADCGGAQFCSNGNCAPKLLVGACTDSTDHKADDVCQTGICLGGACCNSVCTATDTLCKAASCDTGTGACQFPAASVTCGPSESCANGSHTSPSSCNGKGGCALSQPKACDSLACNNDGKTCLPGCHDNSTCPTGNYCAWGQCAPQLQPGATCGQTSTSPANSACSGSNLCLGTFCCATACDISDVQCGANSCDSSGACIYPDQKTTCGALQACNGEQYTPPSACNGSGTCVVSTPHTCEPYICNEPGAVCFATCTAAGGQCAVDSYCGATKCSLKEAPGQACAATSTSTSNQACISGICSGNCCVTNCPADPTTYNCQGLCDTAGACIPKTCPNNFGCSGTTDCNTQCATNADCFAQAFCDPAGTTACCSRFNKGDTIYIDGTNGSDTNPCCGASTAPCQTISHAMVLVANSGTTGTILQVSNTTGSQSWTSSETYPIHLGWGVTLVAPGIHFANQTKASEIFQVYSYDVTDTGTVTIKGGGNGITTDGVYIGFDPALANFPVNNYTAAYYNTKVGVNAAVAGKTGVPLVLSEVWINGNDNSGQCYDLKIGPGSQVTLGPDQVELGNGQALGAQNGNLRGYYGITCKGKGATLQDDPTATSPVLTIESRYDNDLDIEDDCVASLTQGPVIGPQTTSPSYWDGTVSGCSNYNFCETYCSYYANNQAVKIAGSGNLTFGSASMPGRVGCSNYGFDMETSNASGSPTLAVNGAIVDLANETYTEPPYINYIDGYGYACAGAMVTEGTFSASATTFTHAYVGVFVGGNAIAADLSGGKGGVGNTITCNSYSPFGEDGQYACGNNSGIVPQSYTGADLVNATGTVGINAENGTWDQFDTTLNSTQLWTCTDTTYSDCTCSGAGCAGNWDSYEGQSPSDADAIVLSTNTAATPMDTTNGSQATATSCQ